MKILSIFLAIFIIGCTTYPVKTDSGTKTGIYLTEKEKIQLEALAEAAFEIGSSVAAWTASK